MRDWIRNRDNKGQGLWQSVNSGRDSFFDDGCKSLKGYFAKHLYIHPLENNNFKLQNNQEIRIHSNIFSLTVTSQKESKTIYHNICDSWIDVGLYQDILRSDPQPSTLDVLMQDWRVHGNNPDPWDAPDFIKNSDNWETWPPEDSENFWGEIHYHLKVCEHLTSNAYGSIQENNLNSVDDIFRNSGNTPDEVDIIPIKGSISGKHWKNEGYDEPAYDTVSLEFIAFRIEKYETFHTFYIQYGKGPVTRLSSAEIDAINNFNMWDSQSYGWTFNLLIDGTIETTKQKSNYIFPTDINAEIIYDTKLEINKLNSKAFLSADFENLLSPEGLIEYQRLIDDELSSQWSSDYTIRTNTYRLVKK